MAKPSLDWSFDYIPTGDDGGSRVAAAAPAQAAPRPERQRRLLLWLLAAPTLALAVALGVYGWQSLGWQRLAAQVDHEVVTEDEFARAGDVAMVRSFLAADDEEWLALRAAEARQGLPVTLPPGSLRPLDEPPRVESVELIESPLFAATVLRAFSDPAGQVYHFRYTQRYRNLGPGLWERLPTDQAALALQGHWGGARLDAIFPMNDWPWLQPMLPRVDHWLVQACADWQCPAGLRVPVTFTGQPTELRPVRRAMTWPMTGPAATPLVFYLGPQRPLFPPRVVLPSLQVAGLPVEEAASDHLQRAIAVHGLRFLAQQLAGLGQDGQDVYLDALIARAEARLGLSPAFHYDPPPNGYVPPPGLWSRGLAGRAVDVPADLSYRLQALAFLNFALAAAPADTEGALLHGLRRQLGLLPWLQAALGPEAARLPADWTARVIRSSAPGAPLAWQRLDGLTYTCDDGAWLIRAHGLQSLWSDNNGQPFVASSLSADGRYLATLRFSTFNAIGQLRVLEVDTGRTRLVAQGRFIAVLGWSADNRLHFLQSEAFAGAQRGVRLMRYEPGANARSRPVIPNVVRPVGLAPAGAGQANWSPDRMALVLTANVAAPEHAPRWAAIHVRLAAANSEGGPEIELLAEGGYAPLLAPDGAHAVYGRELAGRAVLELQALATRAGRTLVTATEATLRAAGTGPPERLLPMAWSPDGRQLVFMATGASYGDRLFSVGSDGQGLRPLSGVDAAGWVTPLGFSADGRYLAHFAVSSEDPTARLKVTDTSTGQQQEFTAFPGSVAWSGDGHLLALAAEEGVYVLDPATGDRRWLAFQTCQRVSWS